jgi:hypothetical protein
VFDKRSQHTHNKKKKKKKGKIKEAHMHGEIAVNLVKEAHT